MTKPTPEQAIEAFKKTKYSLREAFYLLLITRGEMVRIGETKNRAANILARILKANNWKHKFDANTLHAAKGFPLDTTMRRYLEKAGWVQEPETWQKPNG